MEEDDRKESEQELNWWENTNMDTNKDRIHDDTFTVGQSGAETFGDKGHAMGIPSWTIDGSDPLQFHASTAASREYALDGGGPTLIHVETMRGCGHAHHHDDLYLGSVTGNPPGYVGRELLSYWAEKDPLPNHRDYCLSIGANEKQLISMEEEEPRNDDSIKRTGREIWIRSSR